MQVNAAAKARSSHSASAALTTGNFSFWKANVLKSMECGRGALLPQLAASFATQPGQCASPDACTSMETLGWAPLSSQSERLLLSLFLPPFYIHLGLATYVPGNSFQRWLFPCTLLEVMVNDLDTYWDFADFLRSTVSEQNDVFVFSCPMQAGLQPQEVLVGGLWLSGRTRLLPVGSGPLSEWLCSFPSLIPVSCSS